jgi:hypothetical protein
MRLHVGVDGDVWSGGGDYYYCDCDLLCEYDDCLIYC